MGSSENVGINGKSASVLIPKTRRGKGKRVSRDFSLSILGNNINGAMAKKDSIQAAIKAFNQPTVITLQECKFGDQTLSIPGYTVFSKQRTNGRGGGLLTAITECLPSIEVSESVEDILVVEMKVGDRKIRVLNAYGPQEAQNSDERETNRNFWIEIEKQMIIAKDENCSVILQCDANAKLGRDIFPRDPHDQSINGSHLYDLVSRNNLFILNMDSNCTGAITRKRKTVNGVEASILDYVIVCEDMMSHFEGMKIDEERNHVLTKYSTKKGHKVMVESDHNLLHASFNIKYKKPPVKTKREVFNFKDKSGQNTFHELTENTEKLSTCFTNSYNSFETQIKDFLKQLDRIFHQSFKKIRITNSTKASNDEIQDLLQHKSKICKFLEGAKSKYLIQWFTLHKTQVEDKISELISLRNVETVKTQFATLDSFSGNFSQHGMWKVKRKIFPIVSQPPMAKKDKFGNLITSAETAVSADVYT